MMNRKDFFEYVKDNVKDYLPEKYADANIHLQEVVKKNGLTLTAVVIPAKDTNITPNVYLDSFYQEYRNGKSPDACVGDVADLWIEQMDTDLDVDVNGMMDYANVKDKLQIRMCDPEKNREWLEDKAVTMHGDFAAYYTVNLSENKDGIASVSVTKALLEAWKIDVQTLHQDAMASDKNRGPALYSINDLMESSIMGEKPQNLLNGDRRAEEFFMPMFCLTNETKMNAASLILHEDIRKQIGEFMKGDFYILPSSIHETLLLPDNGDFDVKALNAMVKEVNATEVALEDILSDKVQFCDGRTAVMENAEKREARLEKEKAAAAEKPAEKTGIHGKLEKAKEEMKAGDVLGKPQGKSRDTAMVM